MPVGRFNARRLRLYPLFCGGLFPMYPCARRVGSADPTNQSEDRSDVRSLVSRRKRLLGYVVLQPVASCQPGYPAAQTSSDEEDGRAQGPLMSVPMDPYGPRRKRP